ncbi:MAG: IS30 family transposase, partial [Clostridia bacterium]|nr:IS30 family transposase [Clostridia bacterium]
PYSSYERGSNENQNKLVRRHYPKGISFENVTAADIKKLENWLNHYPRGIFNYHCSAELFEACLNSFVA